MTQADDNSLSSREAGRIIFFCAFGAIAFSKVLGELVGAAFLPEEWAALGPLLIGSLMSVAAGYALGWSMWTLITTAMIALVNWRYLAGDGAVSEWIVQSVIMIGALGVGVLLAKLLPGWRTL